MSQDREQLDYASRGRQLTFPVAADRPPAWHVTLRALKSLGWTLLSAFVFFLVLAALWQLHPLLSIFAGIAWVIVLPALEAMARDVRRRRATVILSYLAQAASLNLPLPRMLDAARQSEPKKTAQRLGRLRDLLEDGAPLSIALPAAAPEVTARTVSLIGAAERLGRLPQALDRAVREQQHPAGGDPSRDAFTRWYPVLMTAAMSLLLMLILVFVMPKFEQIFRDFGLRLPPATRALINLGRGAFEYEFIPVLLGLFVLGILGNAFRGAFGGPNSSSAGRSEMLDEILWRVPLVHGLQRDQGLADAFQTIADALRTGRPLPRAIEEAAEVRRNVVLRRRLLRWRTGMEAGMRADEAAHAAPLPPLVGGMIASGKGGDPAEAAEFLAAYYGGRFSRARELVRAAIVPVLVLLFGALVLFLVAGMYRPILDLMDHLSETAMKVNR
jgi:type II secretory pathway component PulF